MNPLILLLIMSALVASLNPCSLSVIIMSITSLAGKGKHPHHIGLHTLLFSFGVLVTYATLGILLMLGLSILPVQIVGYISVGAAGIICLLGLLEVKDYFWYGKGLSFGLTSSAERSIHAWTKQHHSHIRGFLLGIYTAVRLSHYTVALVASTVLVSYILDGINLYMPLIWSVWYVLPLLLLATLTAAGVGAHSLLTWKEQTKHTMRLSIGLLYVFLGWLMLALLAGGLKLS